MSRECRNIQYRKCRGSYIADMRDARRNSDVVISMLTQVENEMVAPLTL